MRKHGTFVPGLLVSLLTALPAYAGLTVQDGRLTDGAGNIIDFRLAAESLVMDDFRNAPDIPLRRFELPALAAVLDPRYLEDEAGSLKCPERIELDHTATSQDFDVIASANLDVAAPPELVVFNGNDPKFLTATYAAGVLTITPQENTSFNQRYASVTVIATGNHIEASVVIGITQKGKPRTRAAVAEAPQADPINWRAVANTMQRIQRAGSTAVRVDFSEMADRVRAAVELARLADVCKQNAVVCIVEVSPAAQSGQRGIGGTVMDDYMLSPEIQESLHGTEDTVILSLAHPSQGLYTGSGGSNTLVRQLRAYGFDHLVLVESSAPTRPASHLLRAANAHLPYDPAANALLGLPAPEASVPGRKLLERNASLDAAANPPRTSTRRSIMLNDKVLTVDPAVFHFGRGAIDFDGPSVTFDRGSSTTASTPQLVDGVGGFGSLSFRATSANALNIMFDSAANTGAARAFARDVVFRTGPASASVLKVFLDIEQE